ncbi:MAG: aminomethyl transferase family protein, partial [Halohasta sp.]
RAIEGPSVGAPIAMAFVDFGATLDGATVDPVEGTDPVDAEAVDLPFVTGSAESLRLPTYPEKTS